MNVTPVIFDLGPPLISGDDSEVQAAFQLSDASVIVPCFISNAGPSPTYYSSSYFISAQRVGSYSHIAGFYQPNQPPDSIVSAGSIVDGPTGVGLAASAQICAPTWDGSSVWFIDQDETQQYVGNILRQIAPDGYLTTVAVLPSQADWYLQSYLGASGDPNLLYTVGGIGESVFLQINVALAAFIECFNPGDPSQYNWPWPTNDPAFIVGACGAPDGDGIAVLTTPGPYPFANEEPFYLVTANAGGVVRLIQWTPPRPAVVGPTDVAGIFNSGPTSSDGLIYVYVVWEYSDGTVHLYQVVGLDPTSGQTVKSYEFTPPSGDLEFTTPTAGLSGVWMGSVDNGAYPYNTIGLLTSTQIPPIRQYPRDDNLALGAPRQRSLRNGPTSYQNSYRQYPRGSYA